MLIERFKLDENPNIYDQCGFCELVWENEMKLLSKLDYIN